MQGKNKFAFYIILVMIAAALSLKLVNYATKRGEVAINNHIFKVEVLKNEWELAKGLSGKKNLAYDKGMLFSFPKADKYAFWMKDMRFPIDIIWVNEGKIVYIKEKAPIPITGKLESFISDVPAKYVLEINAGLSEKYGFKVGDSVILDI